MVIEQDACYVGQPKPSRAIRFDYMTFYGMSYLTAGNELDSTIDSEGPDEKDSILGSASRKVLRTY